MANLTIKNVPEDLVGRLRERAVRHGRSLNKEVIACLEEVARSARMDPEELLARARAVRRTPARLRLTDRVLARMKSAGRP